MQDTMREPDMVPLNGTTVMTTDSAPSGFEMTAAMSHSRFIVDDLAPAKAAAPVEENRYEDVPAPAPVFAPRRG